MAAASSSKTSLQIQQQTAAGAYGSDVGSKVQVAAGAQAYHHPQHAAAGTPPPGAMAAYLANLAGQQTLSGAPAAVPQAGYPSYLAPAAMMQPTAGHHLLQQLQQVRKSREDDGTGRDKPLPR